MFTSALFQEEISQDDLKKMIKQKLNQRMVIEPKKYFLIDEGREWVTHR